MGSFLPFLLLQQGFSGSLVASMVHGLNIGTFIPGIGHWTPEIHTYGINTVIYPSGIVPSTTGCPYGLVICSPEFVLQWNQWVESVYSGVLRSTYRPYGVLYALYGVPR